MLARFPAFFTFSTHDIAATQAFYEQTLGLEVHRNARGFLELYLPGNNPAVIYHKENHQPAEYTILNFEVTNIEKIVDHLISKGVVFEQYGPPIATDAKGISWDEQGSNIAWFRDPGGNILAVIEG